MIDQLGGRKFVGFLFISVLFVVLVLVGKLPVDQFVNFISVNFGLYVLGNGIEHFSEK